MAKCICHVTDKATGEQYEIKDGVAREDIATAREDIATAKTQIATLKNKEVLSCSIGPTVSPYIINGEIKCYVSGDTVCISIYTLLTGITNDYTLPGYVLGKLPTGITTLNGKEFYGTVVTQGDVNPSTSACTSIPIKVEGDTLYLCPKGAILNSGWVLGGLTFIKE